MDHLNNNTGSACECRILHDNEKLTCRKAFKYLGVPFHESAWISLAPRYLADRSLKAMWALVSRAHELNITGLDVKIKLFKTSVVSIGNYACHVWAVDFLRINS